MDLVPFNFSPGNLKDLFSHPPTNAKSISANGTAEPLDVTFFIIQGLTAFGEKKMIPFVFLLIVYIVILGGNSMIIFLVATDPKLSSPLYFFLSNLSFVDIIFTTTTIPNMLFSVTETKNISIYSCFVQMYFFIQLAITGRAILTVMAYDRYLAICNPLHYTTIMTRPNQLLLIVGAWGFGAFCTLPPASLAWQRRYCGPNVVRHAWCDVSSMRQLACGDTSVDNAVSLSMTIVALLTTGVFILASYVLISVSISRLGVSERMKAIRTCAAHLTVVTISYGSASCVCISYRVGTFTPEARIIVATLSSALTPFLNPMIYSLRNKELQESIQRAFRKFRPATVGIKKDFTKESW